MVVISREVQRTGLMAGCLALIIGVAPATARAAPVTVRFAETVTHGFLVLRAEGGDTLAHGELNQVVGGDRVDSHLVFRFKDGSVYDETVTFSQRRVFRLLSYRLVQRGPTFPEASEVAFSRNTGHYTARLGNDKPAEGRLTVPEDAHNGMTGVLLRNLPPGTSANGRLVAFTPKPQMLDTTLREDGEDRYFFGPQSGTATRYLVKLEVPGVKGVVADILGKSPPDNRYWFTKTATRGFLKFEGAMFLKGPTWRIELGAPRWTP
jgi:hypothetical protein